MAVALSGILWVIIGLMLMIKAAFYFATLPQNAPLFAYLALGLLIGFIKGRFVFPKTVKRVVTRIARIDSKITFKNLYSPGYLTLIIGMMCLGMAMRFVPIPVAIKGVIDIGVGSALLSGSLFFFRYIPSVKEYNE